MRTVGNILGIIVMMILFYFGGYYGTKGLWWLVNYFGIETWSVFVGVVSAIQVLGVLVNARVER